MFVCPAAWLTATNSPRPAVWCGSRGEARRPARYGRRFRDGSFTGSRRNAARRAQHRTTPPPKGPAAFVAGFLSALGRATHRLRATGKRRSLYLRSGDVIPCEVTGIDENGVSFRTSLSASTFVAHDKVKAVELAARATRPSG